MMNCERAEQSFKIKNDHRLSHFTGEARTHKQQHPSPDDCRGRARSACCWPYSHPGLEEGPQWYNFSILPVILCSKAVAISPCNEKIMIFEKQDNKWNLSHTLIEVQV